MEPNNSFVMKGELRMSTIPIQLNLCGDEFCPAILTPLRKLCLAMRFGGSLLSQMDRQAFPQLPGRAACDLVRMLV